MVLLAGGELDLGDGGDAARVLHLPRRLLDALAQHRTLPVQPRHLNEGTGGKRKKIGLPGKSNLC